MSQEREDCIKDEMNRGQTRKEAEDTCDIKINITNRWQNWRDLNK